MSSLRFPYLARAQPEHPPVLAPVLPIILEMGSVPLTGSLASVSWQPLAVSATVGTFSPVRMIFAWTSTDSVPVILGQTNFFTLFDVCFFGSIGEFELRLATTQVP